MLPHGHLLQVQSKRPDTTGQKLDQESV